MRFSTQERRLDARLRFAKRRGRLTRLIGVAASLFASSLFAAQGLFESDEPLVVRLEGPVNTTLRDVSGEPTERDFVLTVDDVQVPVQVRTRGNFRRAKCQFPPLRLNFQASLETGSTFDGQDKLKLVTHCERGRAGEVNVLEEYFAYRFLNLLTDKSFRVRRLHVTYAEGKRTRTHVAFVIESKNSLAARLGGNEVTRELRVRDLDPAHTALTALFHYAIGNTDFSFIRGPEGDDCCHNTTPIELDGVVFSIPYDFGRAGLVDVAYASGNPRLGIRDDKLRRYRGFCTDDATWERSLFALRNAKEATIETLESLADLPTAAHKKTKRFLDRFFHEIAPDRAEKIRADCR